MSDASNALGELLREDKRYKKAAYLFVFDALSYAHSELGMGGPAAEEPGEARESTERHLTGQELCEAIRQFCLGAIWLHGPVCVEQLGRARHGRLWRDRVQLDPHRLDAQDGRRPP